MQDPPNVSQIATFGLKIYHLATLERNILNSEFEPNSIILQPERQSRTRF
jgi:hypothetical protein